MHVTAPLHLCLLQNLHGIGIVFWKTSLSLDIQLVGVEQLPVDRQGGESLRESF